MGHAIPSLSLPRPKTARHYAAIASACLILLFLFGLRHHQPQDILWRISTTSDQSRHGAFPKKVWQTWQGSKKLEDDQIHSARTWIETNPGYGYEILTDSTAREYIITRFPKRRDILETWDSITDIILRADFIRYLTLLEDGGTYTDIDTDCTKPIDERLSAEQHAAAEVVVGLEYANFDEEVRTEFHNTAHYCTWTIMAKPRSLHLEHVVDYIHANLRTAVDVSQNNSIHVNSAEGILGITGPWAFTTVLLESMTAQMGQPITASNMTRLETPTFFGTVLVMPTSFFASGQDHSGSKPWGNEDQLLSHHYSGSRTWRPVYDGN